MTTTVQQINGQLYHGETDVAVYLQLGCRVCSLKN